jgi:hypothetical protein
MRDTGPVSIEIPAVADTSLSLWSHNSFLSIASEGSVLSVGSLWSCASVGSVCSFGSVLSVGSFLSAASALSSTSHASVLSHLSVGGLLAEQARSEGRAIGLSSALAAIALVGAGRAIRRRLGS